MKPIIKPVGHWGNPDITGHRKGAEGRYRGAVMGMFGQGGVKPERDVGLGESLGDEASRGGTETYLFIHGNL